MPLSLSEKEQAEVQRSPELTTLLELMGRLKDAKLFFHVFLYLKKDQYFLKLDGQGDLDVVPLMQVFVDCFLSGQLTLLELERMEYQLTLTAFLKKQIK